MLKFNLFNRYLGKIESIYIDKWDSDSEDVESPLSKPEDIVPKFLKFINPRVRKLEVDSVKVYVDNELFGEYEATMVIVKSNGEDEGKKYRILEAR